MTSEMVDMIGQAVVAAVGDIIPFFLYEAEEDDYPYAVYFYTPEYSSTKDGVYKIATDLTLQVYSEDFDEAWQKSEEVKSAVMEGLNSGKFYTRISTVTKDCVERVWKIETIYRIIQIS